MYDLPTLRAIPTACSSAILDSSRCGTALYLHASGIHDDSADDSNVRTGKWPNDNETSSGAK